MLKRQTIRTLGDLRDHGMGLFACCTAQFSGHGGVLDLDELIEMYGDDYVYINEKNIAEACACKRCGHKGASLRLIADSRPQWVREGAI